MIAGTPRTDGAAEIERVRAEVAACPAGVRLLPVAGATKPALSASARADVQSLDVSRISGIVEYDPAELTVTALAATPIAEVAQALAEHGQYLPFDPPLGAAGATLGGALCAATSGSGAMRHGGIRDFVIGVRLIDGTGRLISGGGRVVKNAAGFDLPKLMVGSRGRLGVVVQISLKVFPRPRATRTLEIPCSDPATAIATARRLIAGPRELDAVDVVDGDRLLVRIGGESEALPARVANALEAAGRDHGDVHTGDPETRLWDDAAAFAWAPQDGPLYRVPLTAARGAVADRRPCRRGRDDSRRAGGQPRVGRLAVRAPDRRARRPSAARRAHRDPAVGPTRRTADRCHRPGRRIRRPRSLRARSPRPFPRTLTGAPADAARDPRRRARRPHRRGHGRSRRLCALRLLSADVSDLRRARRGDGLPAWPDLPDEGGAGGVARARGGAALRRQLPRLSGV